MNDAMHWATDLIGKPYGADASGPEAFNCWGLVRHVFEQVHGIVMPVIATADPAADNVRAIKEAARVSGWRPSDDRAPAADDIVLMQSLIGPHVGVMVAANSSLLLLHCLERIGVCAQPLADLQRTGYRGFVFWRRST